MGIKRKLMEDRVRIEMDNGIERNSGGKSEVGEGEVESSGSLC